MEILLILGIVGWILGYLAAKDVITIKESDPYWRRFIIVPRWLYYICGAPKSSSHPEGSIMARILGAQLSSIVIAFFSLICLSSQISPGWAIFGLFAGGAVPYLIVYYYSKNAVC
ncbi:MAG: hypothetical protein HY869_09480 [Chloroflexi bacterium]|nr:hypothetical protein [Chloroflexota bacterium]